MSTTDDYDNQTSYREKALFAVINGIKILQFNSIQDLATT